MHGSSGHETGVEACHHAAEHYDHAMNQFSSHAGQGVDYLLHNSPHSPSIGDMVRDAGNVFSAQKEMNTVCQSVGGAGNE